MTDTEAWLAARAALRQQDFEAAIEQLLVVVEEDDEDAEALCFLGACYGQTGLYVEAEFYLSKACDVAPEMPQAHFNLARCFQARGQYEMAVRCYENALRAKRDYTAALDALKAMGAHISPELAPSEAAPDESDEVAADQAAPAP